MKAVILAGGLGTRLRPFTEVIPKPLLPIGEKAILEIQIERFKSFGVDEIYLATNYKADYIERFLGDGSRYGVRLFVSKEEKPLGTAGPLSLVKERLTEPFITMNGDILTLLDFGKLYEYALAQKSVLTLTTKREVFPFHFGSIESRNGFVTNIEEKPDFTVEINAGIYVMTPDIFQFIPSNAPYGMDSLILKMLAMKAPVAQYEIKEYWLDIGRTEDYDKVQKEYDSFVTQ